jgi:hypothetical protein
LLAARNLDNNSSRLRGDSLSFYFLGIFVPGGYYSGYLIIVLFLPPIALYSLRTVIWSRELVDPGGFEPPAFPIASGRSPNLKLYTQSLNHECAVFPPLDFQFSFSSFFQRVKRLAKNEFPWAVSFGGRSVSCVMPFQSVFDIFSRANVKPVE